MSNQQKNTKPNEQQAPQSNAQVLLSWPFPEYDKHERTKKWWIWFLLFDSIIFIYAIVTANFLFALIIIIINGLILYRHYHEPGMVEFIITDLGIIIGTQEFAWSQISSYWFAYQPPVTQKLFFVFKSKTRPPLSVPLQKQDPLTVREVLQEFLTENFDKEDEPTIETLGRILRI